MRINDGNRFSSIQNPNDLKVRAERMEKVKKQIETGTYNPDPQKIAEKMLQNKDARTSLGFDVSI